MPVRPIVLYPNPWLRARAADIVIESDPWASWAQDMIDTLAANPGVGIAASQIGVTRRLVVIDERRFRNPPEDARQRVWLNPVIFAASGKTTAREGCMSVPGYLGETARAAKVSVRAFDAERQEWIEERFGGFGAIVAQHEIDHTRGILFLDRLVHRREALRLRPYAVE